MVQPLMYRESANPAGLPEPTTCLKSGEPIRGQYTNHKTKTNLKFDDASATASICDETLITLNELA